MSGFRRGCTATTAKGTPCTQPVMANGLCHVHGGVRAAKVPQADDTGLASEIAMLRRFIREQTSTKNGAVSEQQIRKIGTTLDRLTKAFAAHQRYEQGKRQVMNAHDMAGFLIHLFDILDTLEAPVLQKLCDRVDELVRKDCPPQWSNLPQQARAEVATMHAARTPRQTVAQDDEDTMPQPRSGKPQDLGVRH